MKNIHSTCRATRPLMHAKIKSNEYYTIKVNTMKYKHEIDYKLRYKSKVKYSQESEAEL